MRADWHLECADSLIQNLLPIFIALWITESLHFDRIQIGQTFRNENIHRFGFPYNGFAPRAIFHFNDRTVFQRPFCSHPSNQASRLQDVVAIEQLYEARIGLFFGSKEYILNHVLVADATQRRTWFSTQANAFMLTFQQLLARFHAEIAIARFAAPFRAFLVRTAPGASLLAWHARLAAHCRATRMNTFIGALLPAWWAADAALVHALVLANQYLSAFICAALMEPALMAFAACPLAYVPTLQYSAAGAFAGR